ncbi:hypothetical protein [Streptomyces sp. AP-93]|uniref:hypothetical protein n=1 Tax=Streptomyces sp. AP-93 TaxID=2929048 RepID=UPI001FAF4767|nr:hypothetical protein [Streptomyces sp. AP-93]MCJ0868504.1 hypothetical protein [Streptomyces sp. AP-93]
MTHRSRTILRRAAVTGLSLVAFGGASLAAAGSASAAGGNGVMESGEFGEYYNSDRAGCVWDLITADANFGDNWFVGSGCAGLGQDIDNNTASYWNRQTVTWDVYTGTSRGGVKGWIPGGAYGNYSATFKNQVSSAYPR